MAFHPQHGGSPLADSEAVYWVKRFEVYESRATEEDGTPHGAEEDWYVVVNATYSEQPIRGFLLPSQALALAAELTDCVRRHLEGKEHHE